MLKFIKRWPLVALFIPLLVLVFFSGPALAYVDQWLTEFTGTESLIPVSSLVIFAMGIFAWISSLDLSLAAIKFNLEFLFEYYSNLQQCKEDFHSQSGSFRLWYLFAWVALLMLTFALLIAAL